MPAAAEPRQLCRRCGNPAVSVVRTEPLCKDCFLKYVKTKAVKRMESFKPRNLPRDQHRRLLLPISYGLSSISLLHILDQHLQTQKQRTGRTGFSLHILHINCDQEPKSDAQEKLKALVERYPDHQYSSTQLATVFALKRRPAETQNDASCDLSDDSSYTLKLQDVLAKVTEPTSKADIVTILRTRVAVDFARKSGCKGILWGHTTTRLAEKVLAETAKGRGASVPWQTADGQSPYGVAMYYPLRDVLKKELRPYADLTEPSLIPLMLESELQPIRMPPNMRNSTVDNLMIQYFESIEDSYPSIVSNVVRTTEKLQPRTVADSGPACMLCGLPLSARDLKEQESEHGAKAENGDRHSHDLCYGCARSVPTEAIPLLSELNGLGSGS